MVGEEEEKVRAFPHALTHAHVYRDQIIPATKPESLVPQVRGESEVFLHRLKRRGEEVENGSS